jgi:hypothetical protein
MTTEQLKELVEVISPQSRLHSRNVMSCMANQRAASEEAEVLLSFMFRMPTDRYRTNRTQKRFGNWDERTSKFQNHQKGDHRPAGPQTHKTAPCLRPYAVHSRLSLVLFCFTIHV